MLRSACRSFYSDESQDMLYVIFRCTDMGNDNSGGLGCLIKCLKTNQCRSAQQHAAHVHGSDLSLAFHCLIISQADVSLSAPATPACLIHS